MSGDPQPDLSLIAEQSRRVLSDIGSLRSDLAVLTTIVVRNDYTLNTLLNEIRAMRSQHDGSSGPARDPKASGA